MGSVDVPDQLIRAHTDGDLVLFVGAGASVDPPSALPSFTELAKRIAAEAGQIPTQEDEFQPDTLLGRLDGVAKVHHRVWSMVSAPQSRPNELHEAIIDLANAGGSFRVVTTNYDRHLSDVAAARGLDVAEYRAPALPVGDDFDGLVYLHGTLTQEPRRLIVTDRDFGHAYLTEGWATTFLQRMFHSYTALFIGYSHSDVVMRYLARGLGPNARRFALDRRTSKTNWGALGVTPVWFDVVNESWDQLPDAVRRWARRSSMNLLEHHQRIAALVQLPPNNIPEDMSYLESVLEHVDTAREFTQVAARDEWLDWANTRPQFGKLFDPKATSDDVTRVLAYWYAERFVVAGEAANDVAFRILADRGGKLAASCVNAIGHLLHIDYVTRKPRPAWLDRWLPYLLQAESWDDSWWEYALLASTWTDNRAAALLLFDCLTEPGLSVDRYGIAGVRGRVVLRVSGHHLSEIWAKVFKPHIHEAAHSILAITERHLRRARQLHELSTPAGLRWDPVSIRRDSIATTPNRFADPIDTLIDAARDSLLHLADADRRAGLTRCNEWAVSGVPMLERLATHVVGQAGVLSANDKIDWLIERPDRLFESNVRTEVIELIEVAAANAPTESLDALAASVMAPPPLPGARTHETLAHQQARWQLPLLGAVRRVRSDHAASSAAIDELESNHPDLLGLAARALEPRISGGAISDQPPMTTEELHTRLVEDPTEVIGVLYSYREVDTPWNGPSWNGARQLVTETVAESPRDGFSVLEADQQRSGDLTSAVIHGWSRATLDEEAASEVIDRLNQLDHAVFADDLASLLGDGGRSDRNPTKWARLQGARRLAAAVWSALPRPDEPEMFEVKDWLETAINRPSGHLAQFWLHAISDQWKTEDGRWQGIPPDARQALDAIIEADDEHGRLAEVVLASNLHFLHAADTAWSQQLLSHLRWDHPDRALRNWSGFLMWGQPRDRLLAAGLLQDYLDAALHADRFSEEHRRQLADHLAAVALYSEIDPMSWLDEFTRRASNGLRVQWIQHVAWRLRQLDADAVDAQWNRWMRAFWSARLSNTPIAFSEDDASALIGWTTHLTSSYEEAVDLATRHTVHLGKADQFVHELETQHKPADATGRLLLHALIGTTPPFWDCRSLEALVAEIKPQLDVEILKRIKNEAVRLGCNTAHTW